MTTKYETGYIDTDPGMGANSDHLVPSQSATKGMAATKVDKVVGKGLSANDYTDAEKTIVGSQSGTNTGDETASTIKTKLGVTTLSGANTGDQDLSALETIAAATTALALKADTSYVATAGHTGAYSDLTGKPTIPAAQLQSDWAQTNNASLDFVKNKNQVWKTGTRKYTAIQYVSSATVASGAVTFYITDDGTASGNAVFTNVYKESANFWVEDSSNQYQYSGFTVAANKKSITVTVGKLGSVLLGIIQFLTAANGTTVYLTIMGD